MDEVNADLFGAPEEPTASPPAPVTACRPVVAALLRESEARRRRWAEEDAAGVPLPQAWEVLPSPNVAMLQRSDEEEGDSDPASSERTMVADTGETGPECDAAGVTHRAPVTAGESQAGATPKPRTRRPSSASRAYITSDDLAAVLANGELKCKHVVAALQARGFKKSAAYAALQPDGRFADVLEFRPGKMIAWKG